MGGGGGDPKNYLQNLATRQGGGHSPVNQTLTVTRRNSKGRKRSQCLVTAQVEKKHSLGCAEPGNQSNVLPSGKSGPLTLHLPEGSSYSFLVLSLFKTCLQIQSLQQFLTDGSQGRKHRPAGTAQECSLPRPLTCTLPPGTWDKQSLIPEPALLERAPCPWLFRQPTRGRTSHPTLLALEQKAFSLPSGALSSSASASGDLEGDSPIPSHPFFPLYLQAHALSSLRLGIRLRHIYNGSGAANLFLVMTDKSIRPSQRGGGLRRKSDRL